MSRRRGEESSSSRCKSGKLIFMLCFRLAFWSEFVYRVTSSCRNAFLRQGLLWTDLSKCFIFTSPYKRSSKLVMYCKNILCIDVKGVRKGAHISFETTHTLHIWCFLLIRSRKRPYACLRQNFTIKLRFFKIIFPSVRAFTSLTWEFFWFTLLWEFTGVRNSVQDYALKVTLGDLFIASLKTFRAYFMCHNSLYIFATPRAEALSHEISQSSWFF